MSTRRARIKAVTSLPPRRKNADKHENKITKTDDTSNNVESKSDVTKSKDVTETNTSQTIEKNYNTKGHQEQTTQRSTDIDVIKSPECKANAVSVIRSNVFVSPQKRSPRRTFATPVAPSPKITKVQDHRSVIQRIGGTPVTQKINDCDELQISNSLINKVSHNENSQKKDASGSSTPSSAIDEAVMDGIVPLQPESHAKSIDLLKSDINENADALFDPIIPLPSPGKVRLKLKPVPRLGPHRRNSIQGSASESEDETRRGLVNATPSTPGPRQRYDSHTSISTLQSLPNRDVSRVRNDSICSTTSQVTAAQIVSSPVKEKLSSKSRRQEMNRRMLASKRRREMVKREAMTMYDLIFYNPTTNPIVPDDEEIKAVEDEQEISKKEEKEESQKGEEPEDATPVPQLKLGPNGEITLDESSLVIKRTARTAAAGVVVEGGWRAGAGAGGRYRRGPRSADWPAAETVRFYRALAALGTDFTLMAPLFPDRTRKEIKLKFKKEEKLNGAQVDKALRSASGWDVGRLRDEFATERAEARERARREHERVHAERQAERARLQEARSLRVRTSRASKAMESTMMPGVAEKSDVSVVTANDIVENVRNAKKRAVAAVTNENEDLLMERKKLPKVNIPTTASSTPSPRPAFLSPENIAQLANQVPKVPSNIESGSLVVLTVDDPSTPGKKMLQTYIAHGPHKLTPIALPSTFLNSVVGYMKKNSAKTASNASSPLLSPSSVNSDSRPSSGFQSPVQRTRHTSFNITQL